MPIRAKKFFWLQMRNIYNPLQRRLSKDSVVLEPELKELKEVRERVRQRSTDISDHLEPLFTESLAARPKLIVELGVRGGESTFVLERVARLFSAKLISADIEECSQASTYPEWSFVQKDDILFAQEFKTYCAEKGVEPLIDVLFLDTSHHYEHSVQEIRAWFPHLAPNAKVFFHDTNMKEVYFHKNGTVAFGWNNQRGVIRAIEEYFGCRFNEDQDFVDFRREWMIRHTAASNGFTILERFAFSALNR